MAANIWNPGNGPVLDASGVLIPQSFVGTEGQTVFTLTAFAYTPGSNSLIVFINGQHQVVVRDYTETSATVFTLVEGVKAGDVVDVIGFPASVMRTVPTGACGTATFVAATSVLVVFAVAQPDTNYKISLGPSVNDKTFSWSTKTINGFTINASSSSSDAIDWMIAR